MLWNSTRNYPISTPLIYNLGILDRINAANISRNLIICKKNISRNLLYAKKIIIYTSGMQCGQLKSLFGPFWDFIICEFPLK